MLWRFVRNGHLILVQSRHFSSASSTTRAYEFALPRRTIPDCKLRFDESTESVLGDMEYFPFIAAKPRQVKIALMVRTDDLDLSPVELQNFLQLVGPRYDQSKREVIITCKRFSSMIENKRFAVIRLEELLLQARALTIAK